METIQYVVSELSTKKNYDWLRNYLQKYFGAKMPETALQFYKNDDELGVARISTTGWREPVFKMTPNMQGAEGLLKISFQKALQKTNCVVVAPGLEDKAREFLPNYLLKKIV